MKELEVSITLLLGVSGLFFDGRLLFLGLPLGVILVPFIIVVVISIVVGEVGVVAESLLAVWEWLASGKS